MIKTFLGDCYSLIKNIPSKSIDAVIIDPPYLLEKTTKNIKENYSKIRKATIQQQNSIDSLKDGFDFELFEEFKRICKKINLFIFCSKKQLLPILNYCENQGWYWELIIWAKTNPIPAINNKMANDIEFCVFTRQTGVKIYGDLEAKKHFFISGINQKDKRLYDHPTIKNLELIKKIVKLSTKENDTILDCFMGSGTTGVAAKALNRNFIGIEIEKKYYDIAVKRIEDTLSDKGFKELKLF